MAFSTSLFGEDTEGPAYAKLLREAMELRSANRSWRTGRWGAPPAPRTGQAEIHRPEVLETAIALDSEQNKKKKKKTKKRVGDS